MYSTQNLLLQRLRAGSVALGCSLNETRDPGAVYVLGSAGADVVFIDLEHNLTSTETVFDLVAHCRAAEVSALVRPPALDAGWITRLLDGGCQSLLVPRIRTPTEVAELIDLAYFHPRGRRGLALVGGVNVGYRSPVSPAEATQAANDNLLLGLVIETPEAVERLDELLYPEIGLLVVGHGDLAHAYGVPGRTDHALVTAATARVKAVCVERGIAYGVFQPTLDLVPAEIRDGAQLVIHGGVFAYLRQGIGALAAVTDRR